MLSIKIYNERNPQNILHYIRKQWEKCITQPRSEKVKSLADKVDQAQTQCDKQCLPGFNFKCIGLYHFRQKKCCQQQWLDIEDSGSKVHRGSNVFRMGHKLLPGARRYTSLSQVSTAGHVVSPSDRPYRPISQTWTTDIVISQCQHHKWYSAISHSM